MNREQEIVMLEEQIALCEAEYQRRAGDAFLSTILAEKLATLRHFLEGLQEGRQLEVPRLEEELSQMEAERDGEAEHPSFDWYDEHYVYKVLEGRCDGYRCMLKLLRECAQEQVESE